MPPVIGNGVPAMTDIERPRVRWALIAERFVAAVLAGDETTCHAVAVRMQLKGVPVRDIIAELIVPAATALGDRWAAGDIGVPEEHRGSEILMRLMGELNPRPRGGRRGVAVVATCQDEHHTLPTAMAALALREDRWNVEHLGSGVPSRGLIEFVVASKADVVVLSVTVTELAEASSSLAKAIERQSIPCLVGGPGRTLDELCSLAVGALRK